MATTIAEPKGSSHLFAVLAHSSSHTHSRPTQAPNATKGPNVAPPLMVAIALEACGHTAFVRSEGTSSRGEAIQSSASQTIDLQIFENITESTDATFEQFRAEDDSEKTSCSSSPAELD